MGETETMPSSQEQSSQKGKLAPGETYPEKTDDESYLPTPDARQSPNCETSSEKGPEEDLWKSISELAAELGIKAEKADDEEEEETGRREKADRNMHQSDAAPEQKQKARKLRSANARNVNQEQQASPAGKGKGNTGTPTSSEFQVTSITVSGNEGKWQSNIPKDHRSAHISIHRRQNAER